MNEKPSKRADGTYEETLGTAWSAEYVEDPGTGLWGAEVFHHDTPEWRSDGFASIEDARNAARAYYDGL